MFFHTEVAPPVYPNNNFTYKENIREQDRGTSGYHTITFSINKTQFILTEQVVHEARKRLYPKREESLLQMLGYVLTAWFNKCKLGIIGLHSLCCSLSICGQL